MKRYIYNLDQAYYYIENKIRPIDIPRVNPSTNKVYFTFLDADTEQVYSMWCTRRF